MLNISRVFPATLDTCKYSENKPCFIVSAATKLFLCQGTYRENESLTAAKYGGRHLGIGI